MLRKFAHFQIIGVYTQDEMKTQTLGPKTAHRAQFDFTPRHGFIYVRSRMISSRCNDNFDEFPAEEIKQAYGSFIGKPVFVNHHNEDHNDMRGVIIDAALHEDRNPDGSPDTWVEGLMEVDALRFPKLALALIQGDIQRTSMGVDVQASECSRCGNRASTPLEYCRHIPGMKGKRVYSFTASGARKSELIRERCYGLGFFENSLLVEPPADPTAYTLGQPVLGPGLEHLMSRAASLRAVVEEMPVTSPQRPPQTSRRTAARRPAASSPLTVLGSLQMLGALCDECGSLHTVALRGTAECLDCSAVWQPGQPRRTTAAPRYPNPADHPWFQKNPVSSKHIVDHWNAATPDEKEQGKNWYADAHLLAGVLGEHHAKLHGAHPNGSTHLAAGIIANYSPQQGWAGNMHNAGRVLHENKGIGGPGSGMFASNQQKTAADRMLSGEAYHDVLGGPKIKDFAHLIEHGGDANPDNPHVVIDRHALSVAAGKRMSDDDYGSFPKTQRHYYGHVVQQYHDAAHHISQESGLVVPGHAVQATTWLARQRLNQEAEKSAQGQDSNNDRLNKGRERSRNNAQDNWNNWRQEHLPDAPSAGPGTGYQKASMRRRAYGETKAPADVDTLRDDTCPVCGEENAYDGNECQVCGFQAPPKQFQDPDLDMARRVDLRKDNVDLDGTDVGDLNAQINDVDKDGLDDETGEPIGDEGGDGGDIQPMLSCSNCGTEFEAGEPTTTDTRDPQVGDSGQGPDAGDVCPVCGKGVLETGTEMAEGEEGDVAGADPDDNADRSEGPPEEDSAQEPENDAPRGEEDEDDGEAEGNPFGAPPADDEDPDDGDDADPDDEPPAKKKTNPFKR